MKEPILTDQAKDDLTDIWLAIATRRDEATVDRMNWRILRQCRSHAQFPESGRSRNDLNPGLRSFPVRSYVVFYRSQEDTILVVRILNGRRDIERIMSAKSP